LSKLFTVTTGIRLPMQMIQQVGNRQARHVYEAGLPENFRRPQTDSYPCLCVNKNSPIFPDFPNFQPVSFDSAYENDLHSAGNWTELFIS